MIIYESCHALFGDCLDYFFEELSVELELELEVLDLEEVEQPALYDFES